MKSSDIRKEYLRLKEIVDDDLIARSNEARRKIIQKSLETVFKPLIDELIKLENDEE